MGRQPFRRRKSDNTIDDGTGGGGNTTGMPLVGDQTNNYTQYYLMHNLHSNTNQGINVTASNSWFYNGYTIFFKWVVPKTGTLDGLYVGISSANSNTNLALRAGLYDLDSDAEINELQYYVDIDLSGASSATLLGSTAWKDKDGNSISAPTVTRGDEYFCGWVQTQATPNIFEPQIWNHTCDINLMSGTGQLFTWGNPSHMYRMTHSYWTYSLPKTFSTSDDTSAGQANRLWLGTGMTTISKNPNIRAKITD